MADDVSVVAGLYTADVATDDVGSGKQAQIVKLAISTDGSRTLIPADGTNGMLVNLGANNDVIIDDGGSSITVDGTVTANLAAGTNNIGDVDVLTLPAIPAGNNNIGDVDIATIAAGDNNIGNVDVVTLPSIPAGTNNIGDVDVLTLPALPAGTNNIGDVDVLTLPAIPAGNNNIGDVDVASIAAGDNNIGNVDVESVVPGTGASNLGKTEDGTHNSGDVGVMLLGVRNDAGTALAADGKYIPLSLDSAGAVRVTGGGGGTQYTEGDTDSTITGTAAMWEDASNTLKTVSATTPLPITVISAAAKKISYAASSSLTVTALHSVASSGSWVAGWESGAIDNSSNLYLDYIINAKIVVGAGPSAGEIRLYLVAELEDSSWPDVFDGTESTETITDTLVRDAVCRLAAVTATDTTASQSYFLICPSVAAVFNGTVPRKFVVFITQSTGQNLAAAGSAVYAKGVYIT